MRIMTNDKALREQLQSLLQGGNAHADFESAVKDFPEKFRGVRPEGSPHSPWELLEHLRIAQWDILEFSRNGKHESPEFPKGYWPPAQAPPESKAWQASIEAFRRDLEALSSMAADESVDLYEKIPHGGGQTILRELLLAADHNSYHLGQFLLVRRLLGAWKEQG
jgi:uncharacterized damage-inducible protein DinB